MCNCGRPFEDAKKLSLKMSKEFQENYAVIKNDNNFRVIRLDLAIELKYKPLYIAKC